MARSQSVTAWALAIFMTTPAICDPPAGREKGKPADIYDRSASGAKQIEDALVRAKRDNKRVLLQFGANWCGWCHKLHDLFKKDKDIAKVLLYEYEVVLVDVDRVDGKAHNADIDERYGQPTKMGLPALVVLGADGKLLIKQDSGKLEEGDHHDREKVLAFLKKWQPAPVDAREALSAALARAKAESRCVFVDFSAPWCIWCRRLDAYLHERDVEPIFTKAFVPLKIDIERMAGGKEIDEQYRPKDKAAGGIPFFVILDGQGKKLADSMGPRGNIGFPTLPEEIAHFMKVVHDCAPKLSQRQLDTLRERLAKKQ